MSFLWHKLKNTKIAWYVSRLEAMSLPEVQERLRQQVVIGLDRRKISRGKNSLYKGIITPDTWHKFLNKEDVAFFLAGETNILCASSMPSIS